MAGLAGRGLSGLAWHDNQGRQIKGIIMARKRATNKCRCGCGETPISGRFKKGHDQKLLHKLRRLAGGYDQLERAVLEFIRRVKSK